MPQLHHEQPSLLLDRLHHRPPGLNLLLGVDARHLRVPASWKGCGGSFVVGKGQWRQPSLVAAASCFVQLQAMILQAACNDGASMQCIDGKGPPAQGEHINRRHSTWYHSYCTHTVQVQH